MWCLADLQALQFYVIRKFLWWKRALKWLSDPAPFCTCCCALFTLHNTSALLKQTPVERFSSTSIKDRSSSFLLQCRIKKENILGGLPKAAADPEHGLVLLHFWLCFPAACVPSSTQLPGATTHHPLPKHSEAMCKQAILGCKLLTDSVGIQYNMLTALLF